MNNVLTYKGLSAQIGFDAEDQILTGRIAGINDVIGFHAETSEGIVAAFHEAVDDYLSTCAKVGKQPERPYSGKLMLRVNPRVHARAALAAQLAGVSLNQWSETILALAADPDSPVIDATDRRMVIAERLLRGRKRVTAAEISEGLSTGSEAAKAAAGL